MKSKKYASVDEKRCVACGACTNVCPTGAITVINRCFARVDPEICIGCSMCGKTCPAGCISPVFREAQ